MAVASAVAACPQPGPGRLYQAAREIQRTFTKQAQHETTIAPARAISRRARRSRPDPMCYWAAVRCPPQREITIAKRLEGLGCAIYLPRARMLLRRSYRPATVPLYATYLFADVDQGPPWQAIRRQPGVIGLVMTGDAPSGCPESEIDKLKAAEIDGLVQLAGPPPSDRTFTEGQQVRIRCGAFDNCEARYARPGKRNMSVVMVVLLNRIVALQVPTVALAAISA